MSSTITAGKIPRNQFWLFVNVGESSTPEWELIGKDVEELAIEMDSGVETKKDILGNSNTTQSGYSKQASIGDLLADGSSKYFALLNDIWKYEKINDEATVDYLFVSMFETTAEGKHYAFRQSGLIDLKSWGGGTTGLNTPHDIYYVGEKIHGTFDSATKEFTADADAA